MTQSPSINQSIITFSWFLLIVLIKQSINQLIIPVTFQNILSLFYPFSLGRDYERLSRPDRGECRENEAEA